MFNLGMPGFVWGSTHRPIGMLTGQRLSANVNPATADLNPKLELAHSHWTKAPHFCLITGKIQYGFAVHTRH